ncbi:MAG: hypothetical protein LBM62_00640 [Mediterranea sp.]|jgi:hypothetical protein|nr:hypothetical protein [Mediterranea sp.]
MEEQIKLIAKRLRTIFVAFWAIAVLLIIIGEVWGDNWALFAGNARAAYYGETAVILLTAACVPVSLKLYAWVLARKIDKVAFEKALPLYLRWNMVRMALLALPLLSGIVIYYLILSSTGLLCAAIALTASLFCVPGEKRLRRELYID